MSLHFKCYSDSLYGFQRDGLSHGIALAFKALCGNEISTTDLLFGDKKLNVCVKQAELCDKLANGSRSTNSKGTM